MHVVHHRRQGLPPRGPHRQPGEPGSARHGEPDPVGLIAYDDGAPVGWCAVGPRARYERAVNTPTLKGRDPAEDASVWLVPCFFVRETRSPPWRQHRPARRRGSTRREPQGGGDRRLPPCGDQDPERGIGLHDRSRTPLRLVWFRAGAPAIRQPGGHAARSADLNLLSGSGTRCSRRGPCAGTGTPVA